MADLLSLVSALHDHPVGPIVLMPFGFLALGILIRLFHAALTLMLMTRGW